MKKQIALLATILLSFSLISYSQTITVGALNSSPMKWPGNIQFNNNSGIRVAIRKSVVETPGQVEFLDQEVELSDATINCETLYLANAVTKLFIQGKVTINCKNIVLQSTGGAPSAIIIDNLLSKAADITINYTNEFTQNNRTIEVANTTTLKVSVTRQQN